MIAFSAVLAAVSGAASAQDYAREQRWRAEVLASLVVGDAVDLALPGGRKFLGLYAAAAPEKPAVLLVHGNGVHPDHGVIGILRGALADLGFSTLSIQMPVLGADARAEHYYPGTFPEAAARIAAARAWLDTKGQRRVVLASHSLGSWMSQHYFEQAKAAPFAAWICMGRSGELGAPSGLAVPVLDVYGERDLAGVLAAAPARRRQIERIPGSRQSVIAGADHFYTGREEALAEALRAFIAAL